MNTYVLVSEKIWHKKLFENLISYDKSYNWELINSKSDFTIDTIKKINPKIIFVSHWSYMIKPEIFDSYETIVFHMTDLPFGRGGSPLQNLIKLNIEDTMISAIRVEKGLDSGPIYLKHKLNLIGTAEEIFIRAAGVIYKMIIEIIKNNITPIEQKGSVVEFKRLKREDGEMSKLSSITEMYDYIRMLDAEGYPNAYIEIGNFCFEFSRASLKSNEKIIADVRIFKK